MRNLTVHCQSIHALDKTEQCLELQKILPSNALFCINPDNDDLYILEGNCLYIISTKDELEVVAGKNINAHANSIPVGMEYLSDYGILYCAYASGDIIKITPQHPFDQELAAHIDNGLLCMKLSPDQEILALVTAKDTVITMVSNLQVLSEVELAAITFGEQQFITVGWGHKETQFHGTEGKAAAKAKSVIIPRTEKDSGSTWVTWRGDGTLFAVSFLHEQKNAREFKVFNREGALQYTSELTHGLEENICWKPSGNLIATTQRLPNKHVVALFEKNGLRHRDFTLPFETNEIDVKSLLWSPDSQVLAVWCQRTNSKDTTLQLWSENNYHWYLKQSIDFSESNPLIYYTWSTARRTRTRLVMLTKQKLITCEFRWTINHTRGNSTADKGIVAVVDGDKALLTCFKVGVVPPPMSHQSLHINMAINEFIFAPDTGLNSNSFFCLLQNNQLILHIHSLDDWLHAGLYGIEWNIPRIIDTDGFVLHHFLWLKNDVMLCSASSVSHSYLCVLQLEDIHPEKDSGRIVVQEALPMPDHIHHVVPSPDIDVAYVIAGDQVLKYVYDEGVTPTEIIIPESCDQIEVVEIEKRHVIVALGCRNRLFLDGVEVANNITSLCVHSHFLLLTTLQHVLVSVAMNKEGFSRLSMANLSVKSWTNSTIEPSLPGLSLRRLERASSLVTVIPEQAKVVLQMPRGNLETIQPRALSFVILKAHLDVQNYFAAFDIMRKQRINLNLIYDHNPRLFRSHANKFIDDIKNPCWLNLFISELQEDDVTETIYQSCYSEQENEARKELEKPAGGKVESICQLLRQIMETKVTSRNLVQPILTCLVKNKHIPGLEAALRKVKEFQIKEGTPEGRQQSADEALKYLLYLVDVNVLFDIALGMYDPDLTKFVASKSQKDPKEYIPYLDSLAKTEENYRKFKIDKELKRYDSALEHLAKRSDMFDECFEFICEHNLYAKALKLFEKNSKKYQMIAKMYGKVLMKNRKYREAGVMFSRSGDLDRALLAYKTSGSWQDAIIVSTEMNMNPRALNELYNDLVSEMRDLKRYRDAAEITLAYLEQPEEAVDLLSEGREWRDALRIAHTHKRLDLIETHIKPGVHEHAIEMYSRISENKEEFSKYLTRLIEVRKEKEKREAQALESVEEDENGRGVSDLLSETSSVAGSAMSSASRSSRSSGWSYRSSKNRRKHERKVLSIKEGSAFEDLALIRALHIIVSTTYAQTEEVVAVNRVLLKFHFDELAQKLQNALSNLLNDIEKNKYEIWPKNLRTLLSAGKDEDSTASLLEPRFTYPPDTVSSNWMLDIFEPSTKSSIV